VSRLTSDVKQAKTAISQNLTFFIKNMVVIAASMCVLFSINTKLTLLVLLIVPFYLIITVYYSRYKKILTREYQDV
jgi:ATP-binding cassette, subfamily B, bacterial AbcA/BmrA